MYLKYVQGRIQGVAQVTQKTVIEIRESCLPQSFIFLLTDNTFTSLYTINTGSNLVNLTHNASI